MCCLFHSSDAIDLVAATINTLWLVEHTILSENFVDRRTPALRIVFAEDVVKIACQQSRNAVGHSVPPQNCSCFFKFTTITQTLQTKATRSTILPCDLPLAGPGPLGDTP